MAKITQKIECLEQWIKDRKIEQRRKHDEAEQEEALARLAHHNFKITRKRR